MSVFKVVKVKLFAVLHITLSILFTLLIGIGYSELKQVKSSPLTSSFDTTPSEKLYFPFIASSSPFAETPSIWPHLPTAQLYETALFRHTFNVEELLPTAQLQIFADTRYELWLDGAFIGRGPARFSRNLHEYDIYPLENLKPGSHLIAVLVEWAPNTRRAESNIPILQARIIGTTITGKPIFFQTGSDWKAINASAWQENAALVHSWGLIGPTELLDFRALPSDWMTPDHSDLSWTNAVVVDPAVIALTQPEFSNFHLEKSLLQQASPQQQVYLTADEQLDSSPAIYQPRSIPFLVNTPRTPTLHESGLLSPNRTLISTDPSTLSTLSLPFTSTDTTDFSVEILATPTGASPTTTILLDNQPLFWNKAGTDRPDVIVGNKIIQEGIHSLNNLDLGAYPVYSVSTNQLTLIPPAFAQGNHSGKRLLLAEPIIEPGAVIKKNSLGLGLRFEQTPSYAILKFDRIVHGRLVAEVTGPSGTIVDVGWDIRLFNGSRPLPHPGSFHPEWNQTDSWILDGTTRTLTTIDTRAGQFVLIAVWGTGPVEMNDIVVQEERYPVKQLGTFQSSDPLLNQIWQIGVDTTMTNMLDAFAEPWRERGQWWGDAFMVDRVNRTVFGDLHLLRRGLLFMADGFEKGGSVGLAPNGKGIMILDFGMLWVQDLKEYGTLTQDKAFLRKMYPALIEFMEYLASFENTATGLLDIPQAHWSQSSYIDSLAGYTRHGQSVAVNAFYANTLKNAARVAYLLTDTAMGNFWQQKAMLVSQQINTLLYLPNERRYASTILGGNVYPPDPYAQAWPLALDIVPETEIPTVVTALLELLSYDPTTPNVDVYGMAWVIEGLGRAGYIDEALEIIKLYYGYMLEKGATTWWESFTSDQYYWSSYSHGWGASPTWFLTNFVLGGSWTGPNTWTVRPALTSADSASGTLPVQDSIISISWTHQDCNQSNLKITAPSNTSGKVVLPLDKQDQIFFNGTLLWKDRTLLNNQGSVIGNELHISVEKAGEYLFTLQETCN